MTDAADPIAYTALAEGTPVHDADGNEIGTVAAVLQVEEVAVFDGIVVQTPEGLKFVDADQVGQIYGDHVVTTLSAEEAAHLPIPDQSTPVYDADALDDTGTSMADRFGRMFGRGKWKRER